MKLTKFMLITALATGVCAVVALAQDAGGPPPPRGRPGQAGEDQGPGPGNRPHRPPPSPIFLALDANHDGVIDSNEIANASTALKTLDKNGAGKLTSAEYLPPRPPDAPSVPPPDHQRPTPLIVQALDANHDGVIDSTEIANASAALRTLDKNHDSKLTRDEYHVKPVDPSR